MSEQTVYGAATDSRTGHSSADQGPHPPPAEVEGRGPQVGHADGLRLLHRPHLRRGRDPRAAGRRFGGQRGLRLRHHGAGDRRRADPAGARRGARRTARAGGGRSAVRQLRGGPAAGIGHRDALHEGDRRARGQARGRRARRRADRDADAGRHPGDGAHRLHPAERQRARRLPRPGPRRCRRADRPRRHRRAEAGRSPSCWRWCPPSWPPRSPAS